MSKLDKKAIALATAKKVAKTTNRKRNSYTTPNYRVDVHISSSNCTRTRKGGK